MKNLRPLTSERGSSFVELVVSLPVLLILLVGAADFGRVFHRAMELTAAARAGAQFGALSTAKTSAEMKAAAVAAAGPDLGLTTSDITLAEQRCQCASDTGASLAAPLASTCAATCSGVEHKVYFVVVTASKSFTRFSNYLPGVPQSLPVSRTAWQRIQ
jgi:Flp pilus assembly protein TadG